MKKILTNIFNSLQSFPYHLVPTSPWPLLVSFSLLTLLAVIYMQGFPNGNIFLSLGSTIKTLGILSFFKVASAAALLKIVFITIFIFSTIILIYLEFNNLKKAILLKEGIFKRCTAFIYGFILTFEITTRTEASASASRCLCIESSNSSAPSAPLDSSDPSGPLAQSSILPINFDYDNFLKGLNKLELLSFGNLLLDSLILNATISIIFILYGDYLIKKFNLEIKYPKLANFIKLRKKLQKYSIVTNFILIFIGLIPQIFMCIFILLPKILELFE